MTACEWAAGLIPLCMLVYCACVLIVVVKVDGGLFRGDDGR